MNGNTRIFYHVPTQTSIYFCEREISFDFPTNHTSLVHWPITSGPHDGAHVQTIQGVPMGWNAASRLEVNSDNR